MSRRVSARQLLVAMLPSSLVNRFSTLRALASYAQDAKAGKGPLGCRG